MPRIGPPDDCDDTNREEAGPPSTWFHAGSPQAWRERIREAFVHASPHLKMYSAFEDMWKIALDMGTLMNASTPHVEYAPAARRGDSATVGNPLYRPAGICEFLPLSAQSGRNAVKLLVASGFLIRQRAASQGRPAVYHCVIPRTGVFDIGAVLAAADALKLTPVRRARNTAVATQRRSLYAELRRGGHDPAEVLGPLYNTPARGPSSRSPEEDRTDGPLEDRRYGPLEDHHDDPPYSSSEERETEMAEVEQRGTTPRENTRPNRRTGAGGIMETVPGGRLDDRHDLLLPMHRPGQQRRAHGA